MLSPRSTTRRRLAWGAPALAAVVALTAMGVARAATTGTRAAQVTVTESEFRLQFSTMKLKPGKTTFVAMNKGHVPHSLEVDGPGVSDRRIAGTIAPGASGRLTVTLKKGSYEIYCPVDAHKSMGMDAHLTVGGGKAGAGKAGSGTKTTGGGTTTSGGGGGYG